MKLLKKLDNPILLIAEGFLAGAILFWSTLPQTAAASPDSPARTGLAGLSAPAR